MTLFPLRVDQEAGKNVGEDSPVLESEDNWLRGLCKPEQIGRTYKHSLDQENTGLPKIKWDTSRNYSYVLQRGMIPKAWKSHAYLSDSYEKRKYMGQTWNTRMYGVGLSGRFPLSASLIFFLSEKPLALLLLGSWSPYTGQLWMEGQRKLRWHCHSEP